MYDATTQIELLPPADLKAYGRDLRRHSKGKIDQLAASIEAFGFIAPIIVDADSVIVAGHVRWQAASKLKLNCVPVLRVDHLTPAEVNAYRIADNKLAEGATWDSNILRVELSEIMIEAPTLSSETLGFQLPELEVLLDDNTPDKTPAPETVDLSDRLIVTEPGMTWHLGEHVVMCGDARNSGCFKSIMGDEEASVVFTDAPYNVKIQGHVCGKGAIKHEEFACAVGEMSDAGFTEFLRIIFQNLADHSKDGSIHFQCMDWRHIPELMAAAGVAYDQMVNLIVWNKTNAGMGSLWRSKHELIFAYKKGKAKHINNVQLGRFGRNRTNVWDYAGVNAINAEHRKDLALHPTVKPTAMIADALKDVSHRGDIVLDACGGSGSTLLAAEQTGRRARLIEIDPRYVDVTVRRWQEMTGKQAVNPATGWTFEAHSAITECKWRLENADAA